jgi:hypothetical protein
MGTEMGWQSSQLSVLCSYGPATCSSFYARSRPSSLALLLSKVTPGTPTSGCPHCAL